MGRRGPAPDPSHIAKLRGTYDARKHAAQVERVPLDQPPDCPEFLTTPEQQKWFHHFAVLIWRMGVLCAEDVDAVGYLARDHCQWLEALDIIENNPEGQFQTNPNTGMVHKHPAVDVRDKAHARVQAAFVQFYLTPAARARANLATKPAPKGGGWSRGRPKGVVEGNVTA